jgi:NAD+ diphosphatase
LLLHLVARQESLALRRLRLDALDNPTPVLAVVIQYQDRILSARNAAWPGKMYALPTTLPLSSRPPDVGVPVPDE